MIDTHHIGGFIQNTVKPLVEELDKLLGKCEHLKITKEEITKLLNTVIVLEVFKVAAQSITWIFLGTCGFLTAYIILH